MCAVLGAQGIRATRFRRAQGNQHSAKFESHTNRVTFETYAISITSSIHAHYDDIKDDLYMSYFQEHSFISGCQIVIPLVISYHYLQDFF